MADTHDSLFQSNKLLLFLLPALKVGINQGLQLNEVLVLTLLLDVLFAHT